MRRPRLSESYTAEHEYQEEGFVYVAEVEVSVYCIREGNYSSAALDPDEYYGEYHTEHEIVSAYRYDVTGEGEEMEVDVVDLPKDMVYDIELKCED